MRPGELDGIRITRICVTDDAHTWIESQHSFQPPRRGFGSISDNHLTGMQAITDPHAAAVMVADPGRAADAVQGKV
jgi:hypothetical protein